MALVWQRSRHGITSELGRASLTDSNVKGQIHASDLVIPECDVL